MDPNANAITWSAALSAHVDADNDAALLHEALAFIGDLDFEEDESFQSSTLSYLDLQAEPLQLLPATTSEGVWPPPQQATPTADAHAVVAAVPTQPKATHSYSKRRGELVYLRETVGELELRLAQLRSRTESTAGTGDAGETQSDSGSSLVRAAWEQVAARQCEQRHKAEMENARLKRLLEGQIKVGKSLERLLSRKRPKGLELLENSCYSGKRQRHGSLSRASDETAIFNDLDASNVTQYAETARQFAKIEHQCPKPNHHDIRIIHDPELGLVLQSTECRILPFSFDATDREYWFGGLPKIAKQRSSGNEKVYLTDEFARIQFGVDASVGPASASMAIYFVCRRYVEASRTVICSAGIFNPSEISNTKMDGVSMRWHGWVVLEPVTLGRGSSAKIGTRLVSYTVAVPEAQDHVQDKTRKVGTLTNFLMTAISLEIDSRHDELENRLFEQTSTAMPPPSTVS